MANLHPEITTLLTNVTISGNSAPRGGGGIYNEGKPGQFKLANTIVSGNASTVTGPDVLNGVTSLGYNLISETDGSGGWVSTDRTGTIASPLDARLGRLAKNGGPTQTLAPLPGSPAVDNGSIALIPAGIATDQRGLPRIVLSTVDIGAVEVQARDPDPHVMEDNVTLELRSEPTDFALYQQRAELRCAICTSGRKRPKTWPWVIALNPDDFDSWHHRTMLLVKLQQKDLLAEHLTKMLAKFQDRSDLSHARVVVHDLMTFPTGRPELTAAGELLVEKLRDDPQTPFWLAVARYRAGKYDEADSLFSGAAGLSPRSLPAGIGWPFAPPIFQAFHAMIKAKLNEARSGQRIALQGQGGPQEGDACRSWHGLRGLWRELVDRLSAEALLAEAEGLINGAKP